MAALMSALAACGGDETEPISADAIELNLVGPLRLTDGSAGVLELDPLRTIVIAALDTQAVGFFVTGAVHLDFDACTSCPIDIVMLELQVARRQLEFLKWRQLDFPIG